MDKPEMIFYSRKYYDEVYEYRHVILPQFLAKLIPKRLLEENEWRQAFSKVEDGFIMPYTGQNHTFYYSEGPKLKIFLLVQGQKTQLTNL
ncbi:cyclin-dependent kinases regulatory subunit-like [Schistocerca gregaria]|uniref:cyclin-dependent kinases regulatory subunit-like n=1 Tax=Schistocerca gregaria TaxID=7010 RepID=UPI00211EC6FC|nr:cyclin-dependent kinases regulatory subunit-like [Schistocerca gregaria]